LRLIDITEEIMKRVTFLVLLCGLAAAPAMGTSSLGFWDEGDRGSIHLYWGFEPGNVIEIELPGGDAFDADTSEATAFPPGGVSSPLAVMALSGTDLTYDSVQDSFSSTAPIDVHLKMNNFISPNAYKEVWVEVIGSGTIVPTGVVALDGRAVSFSYEFLEGPGPGTGADFGWRIQPNPSWEEVEFSIVPAGGLPATLEAIHADTICIPAPGALLLASLGAAAIGWLRIRRSL
jgi:hypothetical protein